MNRTRLSALVLLILDVAFLAVYALSNGPRIPAELFSIMGLFGAVALGVIATSSLVRGQPSSGWPFSVAMCLAIVVYAVGRLGTGGAEQPWAMATLALIGVAVGIQGIRAVSQVTRPTAASGSEALRAVLRGRAIRDTLLGLVACVAGGVALIAGRSSASKHVLKDDLYTMAYALAICLVLSGLIGLGKGLYGLIRYHRIRQQAGA